MKLLGELVDTVLVNDSTIRLTSKGLQIEFLSMSCLNIHLAIFRSIRYFKW